MVMCGKDKSHGFTITTTSLIIITTIIIRRSAQRGSDTSVFKYLSTTIYIQSVYN